MEKRQQALMSWVKHQFEAIEKPEMTVAVSMKNRERVKDAYESRMVEYGNAFMQKLDT